MLTPKEMLCLSGVARHLQADEIARELGLSPKTVETHLANIRKKLGVSSSRVAVRQVFGDALQTEPVEGFSSIPADYDHLHADTLNGGGWYAEDHQTSAGMVHAGLVARDRAQRNERHALGGSGDRDRYVDLQSGEEAETQTPRSDALAGKHGHAVDGHASAASVGHGPKPGPQPFAESESGGVHRTVAGDWATAPMELYGSGGRPVVHMVGLGLGDRHSPSPRLPDVPGRSIVGSGDSPSVDTSGLRASYTSRIAGQSREPSEPRVGQSVQGGLTPEFLFRAMLLMGAILGLTILALCLLTMQSFSLWLRHLLFQ